MPKPAWAVRVAAAVIPVLVARMRAIRRRVVNMAGFLSAGSGLLFVLDRRVARLP
jgi:hypothetical protein